MRGCAFSCLCSRGASPASRSRSSRRSGPLLQRTCPAARGANAVSGGDNLRRWRQVASQEGYPETLRMYCLLRHPPRFDAPCWPSNDPSCLRGFSGRLRRQVRSRLTHRLSLSTVGYLQARSVRVPVPCVCGLAVPPSLQLHERRQPLDPPGHTHAGTHSTQPGRSTASVLAIVHFGSVGRLCGIFERSKAT